MFYETNSLSTLPAGGLKSFRSGAGELQHARQPHIHVSSLR